MITTSHITKPSCDGNDLEKLHRFFTRFQRRIYHSSHATVAVLLCYIPRRCKPLESVSYPGLAVKLAAGIFDGCLVDQTC